MHRAVYVSAAFLKALGISWWQPLVEPQGKGSLHTLLASLWKIAKKLFTFLYRYMYLASSTQLLVRLFYAFSISLFVERVSRGLWICHYETMKWNIILCGFPCLQIMGPNGEKHILTFLRSKYTRKRKYQYTCKMNTVIDLWCYLSLNRCITKVQGRRTCCTICHQTPLNIKLCRFHEMVNDFL